MKKAIVTSIILILSLTFLYCLAADARLRAEGSEPAVLTAAADAD